MSKKINQERINETSQQYCVSKMEKNTGYFKDMFDRKLSLVIPGEPISDSRPRFFRGRMYNPKKASFEKLFLELYEKDPLLKKTCIPYPMAIHMRIYHKPKKDFEKKLGKKLIESETVPSIKRQDNDNFEKIHWDILQDDQFRVILDDHYICKNITEKFYSFNERVEIDILFANKYFYDCFKKSIESTVRYNKQMLSSKHLKAHDMGDKEFVDHFKKHIRNFTLKRSVKGKSKKKKKKITAKLIKGVRDYLKNNLTEKDINLLMNELTPKLITKNHNLNLDAFSKYIINIEGKF